jgi:hypothetical protein
LSLNCFENRLSSCRLPRIINPSRATTLGL